MRTSRKFSIEQEEWFLRKEITQKIIHSFIVVNVTVLILISAIFIVDTVLISKGIIKSAERLVTEKIIMTVIWSAPLMVDSFRRRF